MTQQNAAPAPLPEQPIGRFLPDCMTNSGDPCKAFAELRAECERLRSELKAIMDFCAIESDESAWMAVIRNNDGWKKRCEKAEVECERLRVQLAAKP